jgi:hypothetical protein
MGYRPQNRREALLVGLSDYGPENLTADEIVSDLTAEEERTDAVSGVASSPFVRRTVGLGPSVYERRAARSSRRRTLNLRKGEIGTAIANRPTTSKATPTLCAAPLPTMSSTTPTGTSKLTRSV